MIGVRLTDRLGNNLFQYAAARGVGERRATGVALVGDGSLLARFRLHPDTVFLDEIEAASDQWIEYRSANGYAFDPGVANLDDRALLIGYWQSERYFAHIADQLRTELRLRDAPTGDEQDIIDRVSTTGSVALHVRRGDYVQVKRATRGHGVLGLRYYRNALAVLRRRGIGPHVYVFSDDPDWCEAHLDFGATTAWLPANHGAPERDLMVMAACRHHVIANSSYSWWGAWLGQKPGQIVVAPRRWFDGYVGDTTDVVPARWTTVPNPPTADRVGVERVVRQLLRPLGLIDAEGNLRRERFRRVRS